MSIKRYKELIKKYNELEDKYNATKSMSLKGFYEGEMVFIGEILAQAEVKGE